MNSSRAGMAAQNLHEFSKETLCEIIPAVINQFSDKGNGNHLGFVNFGLWGVLMVNKIMRVTLTQINVLWGYSNGGETNLLNILFW